MKSVTKFDPDYPANPKAALEMFEDYLEEYKFVKPSLETQSNSAYMEGFKNGSFCMLKVAIGILRQGLKNERRKA